VPSLRDSLDQAADPALTCRAIEIASLRDSSKKTHICEKSADVGHRAWGDNVLRRGVLVFE